MTSEFVAAWARAFVVTQLVEVPIYSRGLRTSFGAAFAASAITHPIVWFVIFGPVGLAVDMPYVARVVVAELFAWLVEAAFLARVTGRPRAALRWAFVANAASVVIGLVCRALFGYP